jgi:hypothetical protein
MRMRLTVNGKDLHGKREPGIRLGEYMRGMGQGKGIICNSDVWIEVVCMVEEGKRGDGGKFKALEL